ncbi:hypothetical protein IHW74_004551 [Salmonella enterica]|nr:hypothetical protein [Salmonella enterica]
MNAIKFEKFKTPLVITGILILAIVTAHASGSTQEGFDDVWLKISDYMQGSLGKVLIGLIVLVGLAAAVVRQSLMSLAVAVGGAISLYYSPDIINGMMAASNAVQTTLPAFM